jgi:2-polyprenyl-6-methoxyphenol hydroxylase and related FAD-dependent oxidoreductases
MADIDYQALQLPYRPHPDARAAQPVRHPVIVVGAGPVGLTAALDLAAHGVPVVVLDDDCRLSTGSRAICFSKRTLEIWDRLGVGQRMVDKGVCWNVGRVFFGEGEVWRFDLLPETGHRRPAFINLQQYYAEGYLYERAASQPLIDLRWRHKVIEVAQLPDGVRLTVETPDGRHALLADWLLACDGSRSPIRGMIGQQARGRVFRDRFLIADVKMQADFPPERWFWFDPPFHPGQSVLLHRQPDDVWRIDFQMGWDTDPVEAVKPENVKPLVRALLGPEARFELEWVSIYTFACERMERFRHGRIIFAGDSAHRVSPFGARGANSGVQDADNLCWKLALVLAGHAPESLLDTYCTEREYAADENIRHSTRATDFITPKSEISRVFRNTVLALAREHPFARALVNSGRLSQPCAYRDTPLSTPDDDCYDSPMQPGCVALDAPIRRAGHDDWWLSTLGGGFVLAVFCGPGQLLPPALASQAGLPGVPVRVVAVHPAGAADGLAAADAGGIDHVEDAQGLLARRYDARPGTCYLIRPDQHVAARWRSVEAGRVRQALARAVGIAEPAPAACGADADRRLA